MVYEFACSLSLLLCTTFFSLLPSRFYSYHLSRCCCWCCRYRCYRCCCCETQSTSTQLSCGPKQHLPKQTSKSLLPHDDARCQSVRHDYKKVQTAGRRASSGLPSGVGDQGRWKKGGRGGNDENVAVDRH